MPCRLRSDGTACSRRLLVTRASGRPPSPGGRTSGGSALEATAGDALDDEPLADEEQEEDRDARDRPARQDRRVVGRVRALQRGQARLDGQPLWAEQDVQG